jgi:alcohol dehydrogenase (NADP+)
MNELRMKRMPLKDGAGQMPALGFGTLIPDLGQTITATRDALAAGFRHFDCAERYERGWPLEKSRVRRFL